MQRPGHGSSGHGSSGHGSSGHGSYTIVLIVYFQTQGPMHLHIYRLICTNVAYNSAI